MSLTQWSQIATIVGTMAGVVVGLAGLIFVLRQLRQIQQSLLDTSYNSIFSELNELHKVFLEYPILREYFYDDKGGDISFSDDPETYQRMRGIAEMFLDVFVHMYLLRRRLKDEEDKSALTRYIQDICENSPYLSNYLLENFEFLYPKELKRFVKPIIENKSNTMSS